MPNKEGIRSLFDGIASNYDRLNHVMSFGIDRRWRRKAVNHIVNEKKPINVLDVATGTGDFAFEIAGRVPFGSHIYGIDLSEKMLIEAKRKSLEMPSRFCRVKFNIGDCESLQYEDGFFDRVSVSFGVRNFENLDLGLSEMCRVLKKGGRLVILELSYPDSTFIFKFYRFYSLRIIPALGNLISRNRSAYEYLPDSILKFPKPNVMIPKLKKAGFSSAFSKSFTFGICRMYVAEK